MTSIRTRIRTGKWAAAVAIALGAVGFASTAQARGDVVWSVGIGAPGAQVIVGNAPVYVAPPVVVHRPRVYYAPPPVYYGPPPVVHVPRPVYYGSPRWAGPPQHHYRHHHRHHGHGHRHHRGRD